MSPFLILFCASLAGIILLISRRILLKTDNVEITKDNFLSQLLDLEKIKVKITRNLKRTAHIIVWIVLRSYLILINLLKNKIKEIKLKIKTEIKKRILYRQTKEGPVESEPSKYLKVITEYQQKIKRLKHRIKEEEGIK